MRVLILGGTAEGYALAEALARDARFAPVYSLAGRTQSPRLPSVSTRVGGFGGAAGLAAWIGEQGIEAIVDATHPFAARMSANAAVAAARLQTPLLRVDRAEWVAEPADDWRVVETVGAAAAALGAEPRKVFLTIGRTDVAAFKAAPQHSYVIRAVDAPGSAEVPAGALVILERGPFDVAREIDLMRMRGIEVIVSKNSGGEAALPKIVAARQLGIPVVMIARPPKPVVPVCSDVASAVQWLQARVLSAHGREISERGV